MVILQLAVLFTFLAAGELVVWLTGVPVPSSIIGMLLLTLALKLRIVRLRHVEGVADFLVSNLGFFFVPAGVALMGCFDLVEGQWGAVIAASAVSTVIVIAVTGLIHQFSRKSCLTMEFLENNYFLLALTFVVYIGARILFKRTGLAILNPILVSVAVLILFLVLTGVPYETYTQGGGMVEFWLKPAVVALGVPLYKQLSTIRKQILPIIAAELAGCVAGVVSVVLLAQAMGASREVVLSLASKSVTTPIAMEVTAAVGGLPPLTAAVVVCVGIFGGMTGFRVMKMTRVKSPMARGLAMGTAAHALGTTAAIEHGGSRYGAWASLGLTLNGLFTALLTPTLLAVMGY